MRCPAINCTGSQWQGCPTVVAANDIPSASTGKQSAIKATAEHEAMYRAFLAGRGKQCARSPAHTMSYILRDIISNLLLGTTGDRGSTVVLGL